MVSVMAWYCCKTANMARSRYATRNLDQRHRMTNATVALLSLACIITAHHHIGKTSALAETAAFHREAKVWVYCSQSATQAARLSMLCQVHPWHSCTASSSILPRKLALMYSTQPIVPAETCIRALHTIHLSWIFDNITFFFSFFCILKVSCKDVTNLFLGIHHLLAFSNQLLCGLPDEADSLEGLALAGYEGGQGGYLPQG